MAAGNTLSHPMTEFSGVPAYNPSTEFRRFEDDLISGARWQDKEALLREIGAPLLLAPIKETLKNLHETLEAKFITVNKESDPFRGLEQSAFFSRVNGDKITI
jgi:hypothetical protein